MKLFQYIRDIIAPQKCYACRREGHFFCPECRTDFSCYDPFCYVCKKASTWFLLHEKCNTSGSLSKVIVYGKYNRTILQKLISDGKYYGKKEVFQDLGRELGRFLSLHHYLQEFDDYIVISVPMHFLRRWKRGYNQSDILTKEIAESLGLRCSTNIIMRRRYTKQQSHLWRSERLQNLAGAFGVKKDDIKYIKNKNIILVDDVVSTGSTLREVASVLKLYGAKEIIGLVVASD